MLYKKPETILQYEENILWCCLKTLSPLSRLNFTVVIFFFFSREDTGKNMQQLHCIMWPDQQSRLQSPAGVAQSSALLNTIKQCGTPPGLETKVQHHSHYANSPSKSCRDRRTFPPGAGGSPAVLTSLPPRQARARPPRFPPAAAAALPRAGATPPPRPTTTEAVGCKRWNGCGAENPV